MGTSLAWFPQGPALEKYNDKIRPEIERILSNIELPEGEKLFVKLYIIGKNVNKANPMVMVCCYNKAIRKEAEGLIRDSGLLDQDDNIGFGIGSTVFPLEMTFVPGPVGDNTTPIPIIPPEDHSQTVEVYGTMNPEIGRRLVFYREGVMTQLATGGPIIRIGEALFQLTVAHAMYKPSFSEASPADNLVLDECEFDGQSDEEDDSHLVLSRGSLSPDDSVREMDLPLEAEQSQASSSSSGSWNPSSGSLGYATPEVTPEPGDQTNTSNTQSSFREHSTTLLDSFRLANDRVMDMDYWLVKLPTDEHALASNTIHPGKSSDASLTNTEVVDIAEVNGHKINITVVTNRGLISGIILPDSTSVKMSGSSAFSTMLTVLLSEDIQTGDSGSAVVDTATGGFYGHVVLGVPGSSAAYILPSRVTFCDIVLRIGNIPVLHRGSGINSSNRQTSSERSPFIVDVDEAGLEIHDSPSSSSRSRATGPLDTLHRPNESNSSRQRLVQHGKVSHPKGKAPKTVKFYDSRSESSRASTVGSSSTASSHSGSHYSSEYHIYATQDALQSTMLELDKWKKKTLEADEKLHESQVQIKALELLNKRLEDDNNDLVKDFQGLKKEVDSMKKIESKLLKKIEKYEGSQSKDVAADKQNARLKERFNRTSDTPSEANSSKPPSSSRTGSRRRSISSPYIETWGPTAPGIPVVSNSRERPEQREHHKPLIPLSIPTYQSAMYVSTPRPSSRTDFVPVQTTTSSEVTNPWQTAFPRD